MITWPNVLRAFSMRLHKRMENAWFSPHFNWAKTMRFPCVYPSHGKRSWQIWPCSGTKQLHNGYIVRHEICTPSNVMYNLAYRPCKLTFSGVHIFMSHM